MPFRDELDAARARADALARRVAELEAELEQAKGGGAERDRTKLERVIQRTRRDLEKATKKAGAPPRSRFSAYLHGVWFVLVFGFRFCVGFIGLSMIVVGVEDYGNARRFRPPVPMRLELARLPAASSLRGRYVVFPSEVCLLSELTYRGSLGLDTHAMPDCFFPLVSE